MLLVHHLCENPLNTERLTDTLKCHNASTRLLQQFTLSCKSGLGDLLHCGNNKNVPTKNSAINSAK